MLIPFTYSRDAVSALTQFFALQERHMVYTMNHSNEPRFLAYFCGQQKTCSLASEMVEFVTEIVTGLEFDYWWHSTRNKNRYVQNTIEYCYFSDTFTAIVWQPVNWQRLQRPRTVGWGQTKQFTIRLDVARPWLQRKVHIDKNKRSK